MSSTGKPKLPKINSVLVIGILLIFVIPILIIGFVVISKTWKKMKLNDICPDYFSEQNAYIVDQNGSGLDSVLVTLKDNANFNVIYRTFTDRNGKFALFNDFGSFALHNIPFSYELQVSYNGYQDTIKYKFQKYRVCHFRKVEGPDTIVLKSLQQNNTRLITEYGKRISVEDVFEYAPFQKITLTTISPSGLKKGPGKGNNIKYGSLNIGSERVLLAVADSPIKDSTEGAWYVLDRNTNGDLSDDPIKAWNLLFRNGENDIADCNVRQCFLRDTLVTGAESVTIDLQLNGLRHNSTYLYYRRGDAFKAIIPIEGKRLRVVLWDRLFAKYTDLRNVQIGIDLNGDGRFSTAVGDAELLETAVSGIKLENMICEIDSITQNGSVIYYRKAETQKRLLSAASVGAWATDFKAFYAQPISLYNEISSHEMVLLCFFEGNSQKCMEAVELGSFISTIKERMKNVKIIGVNRRTVGEHYSEFPVIEENMGWKGLLVRQFHNHLDNEIICIDSTATIISRGKPGKELFEALWPKIGRKDLPAVLSAFELAISEASIAGTLVGE